MSHPARILSIIFSVLLMLPLLVEANPVNSYYAEYKVSIPGTGTEIGSSTRKVYMDDLGIVVSEHSLTPHPLLVLLGIDPFIQISRMKIDQNSVQSRRVVISSDGADVVESADFDWEERSIMLMNGDELSMPSGEMYDVESWLMSLTINPFEDRSGNTVSLVENNKIQIYTYDEIQSKSIDVAGRTFEIFTFKIQSAMGRDRSITVTMSPDFGESPIRIIVKKDDFVLNFELVQFERLQ